MGTEIIDIRHLTYSYGKGKRPVYTDFSLTFAEGGVYGLLGKNGTGKSTLLYLICGLLRPQKGEVLYRGIGTAQRKVETLQDMFIVPEEFSLPDIPLRTYVKINAPFYPKFSEETMKKALQDFELDDSIHLKELSMGQKKKAFMSFALAANTRLLLMDEPTNGLDIPSKSQFRKVVATNMTDDKLVLVSTHQVRDIDTLLDHVTIIDGSDILLNSSVTDITRQLAFDEVEAGGLPEGTLYAQPSYRGNSIVRVNTDDEETPLNLELLFNATLAGRDRIKSIFNN